MIRPGFGHIIRYGGKPVVGPIKKLHLDPAALGHVAVVAIVGTGAGDIIPLGLAIAFQVGVEANVEG